MPDAFLWRFSSGLAGTFGRLCGPWGDRLSVELPWRDNAPFVSCIPARIYIVRWTYSPHFGRMMYEVMDVPGRSGIRWHVANWARNLKGCIGPGRSLAKFGNPKTWGVTNSGSTLDEIEKVMATRPFRLHVRALVLPP